MTQGVALLWLFWARYAQAPLPVELPLLAGAGEALPEGGAMPGDWVNAWARQFSGMAVAATSVMIFWTAFLATKTIARNLIYTVRTYLPLLFFVIASCGVVFSAADPAAVVSALLIMYACADFVALAVAKSRNLHLSFRSAFLLGLSALLYPPALCLFLLLPLSSSIFRRSIREAFVGVVGFCIPLLGWAYIVWAMGGGFATSLVRLFERGFAGAMRFPEADELLIARLAVGGIFVLIALLAFFGFLRHRREMRTRSVRVHAFMFGMLLISAGMVAVTPFTAGLAAILAIPLTFVCPLFFIRFRGLFADFAYLILLAGLFIVNILPLSS